MFCPNCGNKLNGNEIFCPNCAYNLNNNIEMPLKKDTETLTDKLSKNSKDILKKIINFVRNFVIKFKKPLIILSSLCLVIIVGLILFNNLYDFTKIEWDKSYSDINTEYTESTTLKLNVLAYDKKNNFINDIKFSSNDGSIISDGTKVEWSLPKKEGTYTINAIAPSGKKIKKTVNVVELEDSLSRKNLAGLITTPEDDSVADSDADGLTNKEEKNLGTNIYSADTDKDGIPDKLEIDVTKTDPLKIDTDGDSINDGDELDLGLDPLKIDSKDDGINDKDRTLTYKIEEKDLGVSLEITGKGNISSTTIDIIKNSTFSNMDGLIDKVYNFYSTGEIDSALVTINYDVEEIKEKELNEDNLTLYYFNEESKELEALPTEVNKEDKTITVTLKHFSKYVIGDKSVVLTNTNSQIMFVIDNSVSMYSSSQMLNAGYNSSQGAIGNDTNFKRLSLTNNMIDMFTGNYEFGVAEFSGDYVNLYKFSKDIANVKKSVSSMKNNWKSNGNGTDIITALDEGIEEFKINENNHYLILLTDGKNTEGSLYYSKDTIIEDALEKNVHVCVIGLGSDIDTDDLDDIAESTGCDYYNATDSSALDEIYKIVGSSINYNLVDTDNDNKVDGMIEADSGFIVTRDGFPFANFSSNKSEEGHCYGMATFAMLYYKNELPLKLDKKDSSRFYLSYFKTIDLSSNGYDLNNTFISRHENLYDYKITNKALDIMLNDNPGDYRDRVENKTWMIKKEYYDELKKIGATITIKDYDKEDKDFTKYQSALLNIDNDTFNKNVKKDESQLINAIWRLFILQSDDEVIDFSPNPDESFKKLSESLEEKTPLILGINGNHAINAIRLIQDINDSNKFKIEVYDNNYHGETKYIDVIRNKYNKFTLDFTAWTNKYNYTFSYNGKELPVVIKIPKIE